ncbi:MAG TPA: HAD family hydrolase [Alphaproteobacteria bacterium]|nr:HAD family hydrolase [Alphaproteobacteria bacterium]
MSFSTIATDYDGTLAEYGHADERALKALQEWCAGGGRVILITGRELASLQSVCAELELFELVVAENGAVLYFPATGEERPLASPPPQTFVQRLRDSCVQPLSVGRCIVATEAAQEPAIMSAIHELRLKWSIIHNRESVMALPRGVDKASGLSAALAELDISAKQVIGIGDGENDLAFLDMCGYSVAVANAVPQLKRAVDLVTRGTSGAGVVDAVHHLLSSPETKQRT